MPVGFIAIKRLKTEITLGKLKNLQLNVNVQTETETETETETAAVQWIIKEACRMGPITNGLLIIKFTS